MGRPRSASAPRERGPRAQHKNSPSKQQAAAQQFSTQQQESQLYKTNRPSKSNLGNVELPPLKSLRPASANGRPLSANGTPRSACASQRSAHSDDCVMNSNRSAIAGFSNSLGAEKCVCFICTCGKHHCPPAYKPNPSPLDANTHYSDTYKAHEHGCYPERVVVQSTYVGTRAAPGHFDTMHKAQYIAPETKHHNQNFSDKMERSTRARQQPSAPREVFDHSSVQRQDYPWHDPNPAMPIRPSAESPISAGPFMGITTTKDTFKGWTPSPDAYQRANHAGRNSAHTAFSNDPADFNTSYKGQYVEHAVPTRSPAKPKATYSYGTPRTGQFQTSNQLSFTGQQNPICPAHMLPPRPASASTGHVKYRLDLTGTWA